MTPKDSATVVQIKLGDDRATPDVTLEYRPNLGKWDVFILGWGSGGGRYFFGRYDMHVVALAAMVVAQHEYDYHRPGLNR
jgi:hypothetical protein